MKTRRAEIATGTLLVIAFGAIALGMFIRPRVPALDSRTRDAKASVEASAEVEKRHSEALAAEQAKGAKAAASVQQIGVAAGQLPDSPQREFIAREASLVIPPLLPAPDPKALIEAERRRVAILEGKLQLADRLYADATKDNAALIARATKAEAKLAAALAERRETDTRLVEAAAYSRGKDAVIAALAAIIVLCVAGWIFAKLNGIGPRTLGMMSADLRAGHNPQEVLDRYVPVRLWKSVRHARVDAESDPAK